MKESLGVPWKDYELVKGKIEKTKGEIEAWKKEYENLKES